MNSSDLLPSAATFSPFSAFISVKLFSPRTDSGPRRACNPCALSEIRSSTKKCGTAALGCSPFPFSRTLVLSGPGTLYDLNGSFCWSMILAYSRRRPCHTVLIAFSREAHKSTQKGTRESRFVPGRPSTFRPRAGLFWTICWKQTRLPEIDPWVTPRFPLGHADFSTA